MAPTMYTIRAPGKLILSGEHAVVYDAASLATVFDRYTVIRMSPIQSSVTKITIEHEQLQKCYNIHREDIVKLRSMLKENNCGDSWKTKNTTDDLLEQLQPHLSSDKTRAIIDLFSVGITDLQFILNVSSELPIGGGLGSSASFCTALAAAFAQRRHLQTPFPCQCQKQPNHETKHSSPPDLSSIVLAATSSSALRSETVSAVVEQSLLILCEHVLEFINYWAFQGERLAHGNPSGVDNTCTTYGGIIVYQRGQPFTRLMNVPPIRLLIADTGVPRDTKRLVKGVSKLLSTYPAIIQPILNSINEISQCIRKEIEKNPSTETERAAFQSTLGTMFTLNQHLLNALGVGHVSLDQIVSYVATYGLQAKLTGAGGGGCAIVLLPPRGDDDAELNIDMLCTNLRSCGYAVDVFETIIGQRGVSIE